jgi:hypothetical protein
VPLGRCAAGRRTRAAVLAAAVVGQVVGVTPVEADVADALLVDDDVVRLIAGAAWLIFLFAAGVVVGVVRVTPVVPSLAEARAPLLKAVGQEISALLLRAGVIAWADRDDTAEGERAEAAEEGRKEVLGLVNEFHDNFSG